MVLGFTYERESCFNRRPHRRRLGYCRAGKSLWTGWSKVLIGLLFSTFLGFFGGLLLMALLYRMLANSRPGTVRRVFGRLQIVSAGFMAFSHGSMTAKNLSACSPCHFY